MLEALYRHTIEVVTILLSAPVTFGDKFYYVFVLSFVVLAYFSYRRYERGRSSGNFLKFLFPKNIYFHKSARVDYGIYLINLFISPLLLVGAGLQTLISIKLGNTLVEFNGGQAIVVGDWDAPTYALFIVGFTLVADFSVYLIHRLHHQSDVLWPIHALHHSAEVMTPVTLFRKHPVWNLCAHSLNMALTGLFQGVFIFVFYGVPAVEVLFGINTAYVLYNFFGANLRHSHVWLSWGKPLSYLFISPAMHQIHHDPTRMRKNYGEVFALWDWMFGTLYIPTERERFKIGLAGGENPHDTLWRAYYEPLAGVGRQLLSKLRRSDRGVAGRGDG